MNEKYSIQTVEYQYVLKAETMFLLILGISCIICPILPTEIQIDNN